MAWLGTGRRPARDGSLARAATDAQSAAGLLSALRLVDGRLRGRRGACGDAPPCAGCAPSPCRADASACVACAPCRGFSASASACLRSLVHDLVRLLARTGDRRRWPVPAWPRTGAWASVRGRSAGRRRQGGDADRRPASPRVRLAGLGRPSGDGSTGGDGSTVGVGDGAGRAASASARRPVRWSASGCPVSTSPARAMAAGVGSRRGRRRSAPGRRTRSRAWGRRRSSVASASPTNPTLSATVARMMLTTPGRGRGGGVELQSRVPSSLLLQADRARSAAPPSSMVAPGRRAATCRTSAAASGQVDDLDRLVPGGPAAGQALEQADSTRPGTGRRGPPRPRSAEPRWRPRPGRRRSAPA